MPANFETGLVRCSRCGTEIEVCAFCQRPDCSQVVCYRCLRVDLGESMDHPHPHGG